MKRFDFSIFLIVFMTMIAEKLYAYDFSAKNAKGITIFYNYINDGKELEVTFDRDTKYEGDIVIPEKVTYKNKTSKVTAIGDSAFYYHKYGLYSVSIPKTVVRIGDRAFYGCNAMSVKIPESVTSIGVAAFCFCRCSNNSDETLIIPDGVKCINDSTFWGCEMSSVKIGSGVTKIGKNAFAFSNFTSVNIPNNVESIGDFAFWDCMQLVSVNIGDGVIATGNGTFGGCSELSSVTLGKNLKTIDRYTFEYCKNLTSITIPNGVTRIRLGAFAYCETLEYLLLPNSVSSIDALAFEGTDIKVIVSQIETPSRIVYGGKYSGSFSYNTFKNGILYVPYGSIEKYKSTEGWMEFVNIREGTPKPEDVTNVYENHVDRFFVDCNKGTIVVHEAEEGTLVRVYTVSGNLIGTSKVLGSVATIRTDLKEGDLAIVRIGDKLTKVIMQ